MIIKNLATTPFEEIIKCFTASFSDYAVKMPTDPNYWKERWSLSNVDYRYSFGMFDGERLVGFIINAVGHRFGHLTAHNSGTGVLPEYRGQRIIKKIYAYAIPKLKKNGFTKTTLEVIKGNTVAVKAYQSVGYKIIHGFLCYNGLINLDWEHNCQVRKVDKNIEMLSNQKEYSWDFQYESLQNGDYSYYQVWNQNKIESNFILQNKKPMLAQFDVKNPKDEGAWKNLFSAIQACSIHVGINNVHEQSVEKVIFLKRIKIPMVLEQYQMEMLI